MASVLFFLAIQNSDLMAPTFVRPLASRKGIDRQPSYLYLLLSGVVNPLSANSNKNKGHFLFFTLRDSPENNTIAIEERLRVLALINIESAVQQRRST